MFYVYVYLTPLKPGKYIYGDISFNYEPFYVGKGKGDRSKFHLHKCSLKKSSNKLKNNIIEKILKYNEIPIINKVYVDLDEDVAFKKEIELIKIIGRRDLNNGTLSNLSDGGEGLSGKLWTEDEKDKKRIGCEVIQYDNMGIIIKIWKNVGFAATILGLNSSQIHKRCRIKNKLVKCGGFYWKYLENEKESDIIDIDLKYKPILQYDLNGVFKNKYYDSKDVNKNGFHSGHVKKNALKNLNNNLEYYEYEYNKYIWLYQLDNVILEKIKPYKRNKKRSAVNNLKIQQFSKDDVFLQEKYSFELREQGFKTKTIFMCCRGELKTSQGFKWKYKKKKNNGR